MCEISEERTYYIRTSLMYTDMTREVLFKVFKYLIKSDDIAGFLSSLEQQNKLRELLQRHVLNQPDYNLVSSQVLNLERFDISLLLRLILNLSKDNIQKPQCGWETKPNSKDESLGADLLRLRDVRNKIIGHRADAKLSEPEYEKTWAKIKAILLRVVELVDSQSSENFEQRINGYKRLIVDTENVEVKRLLDELQNYKTEFDHLQEKVEELSRRSKEFKEYFKTTPEIFVRYIKLLFDGGRIVLCGIMKTKLGDQDLSDFLERKKETLTRNIDEKYSRCIYLRKPCPDYKNWDVYLLASILLLTFDDDLSQKEIMYIERIKSARVSYAALALQSLDTVDFVTNWIDLINCLNHLSINICEDDKLQVEYLIEHYKKKVEGGCDADEYFNQLRESGVDVKTLNDVYKETIKELGDMLNQLSQKDIKFENGFVLEFKLLTLCENEEIKKEAEDLLEINLQASIQKSDQLSGSIRSETDKVVAIIAAHPDVTPVEVKRKCIIWSFKCSTPGGLLHILDITHGDQLRSTFRNIANELYYIYGYPFLIQGKLTLESVSGVSRMLKISTSNETSSEHLSIPLKCSSVDGINSVLFAIKMEKTTNSLNRIAEQMSAEFNETVSIKLIHEMMKFQNVLEETDSEGSSSLGKNEDEAEEIVPTEMGNKNDKENTEEHVDFIIDNKCTLMHADETDIELVRGHADDEKNKVFAAQQFYDEKMKEYDTENEEAEMNIIETFETINLGQARIRDMTVSEKWDESKLLAEGSSSLDSSSTEDETEEMVPGAMGFDKLAVAHMDQLLQRRMNNELKPNFYPIKEIVNEAARYLREGLKDNIIKFSKENFKQLRLKVLNKRNTTECNYCRLDTSFPGHSSQSGRCPLGQMYCNCVFPGRKIPCPSNFCNVMYDEIIKQHRTSSVRLATANEANWHQNHCEITKFFLSSNPSTIGNCKRIEDLECVDCLDIMINNLEFQKEISCQIDPPFDVVSKVRSYLRKEVYTTDDDMFKDLVQDMITLLTSFINQMPSTHIAVQNLKKLEKKYDVEEMYIRRGFQNESDKLKESIKKQQICFTRDEDKMERFPPKSLEVDIREKQYEDTMKMTGRHVKDIGFKNTFPILLPDDEFERVLIEADTSCRVMAENKTDITEGKLLNLQDKIEYLIQASRTLSLATFQHQYHVDSIRKSFLNIKNMFLSGVATGDMEHWDKKRDFLRLLSPERELRFGCRCASLVSLDSMYLYSREGERIRSEKDIFYQRGSLSKNIVVSGSTSSCKKFFEILGGNCSWHTKWLDNEFKYVFRLSLRYVKETHIHDMIKNHILKLSSLAQFFEQVLFREADKCLIILEELDKWETSEHDTVTCIHDIKKGTITKAHGKNQLPKRNHMTDYVVLIITESKNVGIIRHDETDRWLYLKDSESDSDTFSKQVSQGEKNVQLDRDSITGPSKYRPAALPAELSSESLQNIQYY